MVCYNRIRRIDGVVKMMNKIRKVLKGVTSIFLILLVTLCVYTFIVTDIMKKDYVNVFGYTYFVVATGSMSGAIEVDDIIFVKLNDKAVVGDIVTYKNTDGEVITHRVVEKNGNKYICQGDVNNTPDDPINKDQIIGVVKSVVSPSFILKSIAIFLILFIFLSLINFDKIIKKYVVNDDTYNKKLPDDIFEKPGIKVEEPSSGLTVTISINEMEKLNKAHEKEFEKEEIEVLDFDEYLDVQPKKKQKRKYEKETIDLVISILKCKKNNVTKARMTKKWLIKYQYVYKICHLLLIYDTKGLVEEINNPTFTEIYNYDLDRVGLTETIRNKIYEMPIHIFLRILVYSILYNDEEMFDGVYKILKYKVMIDKDNYFKEIRKTDTYSIKQIKTLISFMKKISNKFDNKKVFELEKIERIVKIRNY